METSDGSHLNRKKPVGPNFQNKTRGVMWVPCGIYVAKGNLQFEGSLAQLFFFSSHLKNQGGTSETPPRQRRTLVFLGGATWVT